MTITELRKKHHFIEYQGFNYQTRGNNLHILFNFFLDPDIFFNPKLILYDLPEHFNKLDKKTLDNLIFTLGLIELISYYKTCCPEIILISAAQLEPQQINWFKNLLLNGLGEFFYTNHIHFDQEDFVTIQVRSEEIYKRTSTQTIYHNFKYLVPIGGGKDSAVVLDLLDKNQIGYDCLIVNPASPAAHKVATLSHASNIIKIDRTIDPLLLKLNQQGYLNGHTPYSAFLAQVSTLVAFIFNYSHVLVANESSANEENINYLNKKINHQYSKSYEFEASFRKYSENYLLDQHFTQYLSFLRPLNELQIAKLFSQATKFHSVIRSCNLGQQKNIWCQQCAKCLFVYIILSAFIDKNILTTQIFDHDLLNEKNLFPLLLKLTGLIENKPFECVGTYQDTQIALYLNYQEHHKKNLALPLLLDEISKKLNFQNQTKWSKMAEVSLKEFDLNHFLPEKLEQILKKELF